MSKIKFEDLEFTDLQYDELRMAVDGRLLSFKDEIYNLMKKDSPESKERLEKIRDKTEALEEVKKKLSSPSNIPEDEQ